MDDDDWRAAPAWGTAALRPLAVDALMAGAIGAAELLNLYREVVIAGYRPPVSISAVVGWLVLMSSLLIWRRRRPLAVLVAIGLSAGIYAVLDLPTLNLPVLVAVFSAGALLGSPAVVATALVAGVVVVNLLRGTLSQLPIDLVVFGAVWLLGAHLRVRQLHAQDVQRRREAELWRERSQERARVARELHDIVSNGVGGIYLQAVGSAGLLEEDPQRARAALDAIQSSARVTLDELRTLLDVLRLEPEPSDGRPTRTPAPCLTDLPGLIERTRVTGATVGVEITGDIEALPASVSTAGYRTIQEGLGNATRHGADGPIRLKLVAASTGLRLEIINLVATPRATGEDPGNGGVQWGLTGLRERIAVLGGRLETREHDGEFLLIAELPSRDRAR